MFYPLSKIAAIFLNVGNVLLALAVTGLALLWIGKPRLGRALLTISVTAMILIGATPVGSVLLATLESRFPPWNGEGPVDGIVVLGGAIDPGRYFWRPGSGMNPAIGRVSETARLAGLHKSARVIFAGGNPTRDNDEHSEAAAARDLLIAMGVDAGRITLELDSRNTCENAWFLKQEARPKPGERWLIVTSAFHMARAIGCFRSVGFPVTAYPVDFRVPDGALSFQPGLTYSGGLERFSLAVHEFFGLITYRMAGRIPEVFPAP